MTLINFLFSKLRIPKTQSDKCLKSPVSEDYSTSNMVNLPIHCWNLHHCTFTIYWSQPSWKSWKKFLLLTWKILVLLVNTLAANENYPVINTGNLTIPIEMQLSQKRNTFSRFLLEFLKFRLNLKHFEKKKLSQILLSRNYGLRKRSQINVWKVRFERTLR